MHDVYVAGIGAENLCLDLQICPLASRALPAEPQEEYFQSYMKKCKNRAMGA